jgi:hypothetical protein
VCSKRHHLIADPLVRSGHPDGEQPRAEGVLPEDEGRPPGRAALLGVPVGEKRSLLRHGVDVGCFITHHPLVISAHVPVADVITPDDQDVRFVGGQGNWSCKAQGQQPFLMVVQFIVLFYRCAVAPSREAQIFHATPLREA